MLERTAAVERPQPVRMHARVREGLKRPHNWVQLAKFLTVGASGYAVNLAVFTLLAVPLDIHHVPAATAAFLVAVTNNFWWNRHWTFGARDESPAFQAPRFLTVSVVAFLFQVGMLELLVLAGLPEVPAQALSVAAATPLNFLGNKLWSFGRTARL
ncbi:MAG: GtrA family protein [Thermoleophilaceae bacterium]|nr:GtrA family protein [Thermoleophilaceae bacterium]